MSDRETAGEIEERAIEWVWRLDREGDAPDVQAELEAWLDGDTRRRGALLHARAAWSLLDRAQMLAGQGVSKARAPIVTTRRAVIAGGAALAAGVAGAGVFIATRQGYRTTLGEIRRIPLKDGSQIALNTQSRLAVNLEPSRRTIDLKQGEAWFHVAKDRARPFVVEAGDVRVRAVGTAFSVRRREGGADVLVTEGVVEAWSVGGEERKVRLSAGAEAYVSDRSQIVERPAATSDVDRKLAWRDGRIDLRGETLAEAVAEFNRYNDHKLTIADPRIASEPLYGVFRTDDPAGFATAAAAGLGVSAHTATDGAIVLGGPLS